MITILNEIDLDFFFIIFIQETELLEISSIRDTRTGKYAKTPKNVCIKIFSNVLFFERFINDNDLFPHKQHTKHKTGWKT